MKLEKPKTEYSKIKKIISEFNKEIQSMETYEERRKEKTTKTIFYDTPLEATINLEVPPVGWATIPESLTQFLSINEKNNNIICYDAKEEAKLLEKPQFFEKCKNKMQKYLNLLSECYLNQNIKISEFYDENAKKRIQEKIESIKSNLHAKPEIFNEKNLIIPFLKKELHYAKTNKIPRLKIDKKLNKNEDIIEKVKTLRKNQKLTVEEIAKTCKISVSKYYDIVNRIKLGCEKIPIIRGRPPINRNLSHEKIQYIKELVDSPENSFTVPDLCLKLYEKYEIDVSKKTVYYYLTKVLNYSYKRNHFKNKVYFSPEQNIVRFKTCRKYLKFLFQGMSMISCDESGFFLKESSSYGYSSRQSYGHKIARNSFKKFNVITAISDKGVFAYSIRTSNHNLHSFLAFLIDLTIKIYSLPESESKPIFLSFDRAKFHLAEPILTFLKLVKFPILLNAPAFSDFAPIELFFGKTKLDLKRFNFKTM